MPYQDCKTLITLIKDKIDFVQGKLDLYKANPEFPCVVELSEGCREEKRTLDSLLFYLEHPERNPLLTARFDVKPKAMKRTTE